MMNFITFRHRLKVASSILARCMLTFMYCSLWGSTATVCQVVKACQSAASATRERKMSSELSGAPALLKFHARLADGSEPPQIHICAQAPPNDVMFGQAVPLSGLFSA